MFKRRWFAGTPRTIVASDHDRFRVAPDTVCVHRRRGVRRPVGGVHDIAVAGTN
jgi:hypothetical protein